MSKTTLRLVIVNWHALLLQRFPHQAELVFVTPPSADRASVDRLPNLHSARRRHRRILFVKMQAGVFPWQFQKFDQRAGIEFEVASRVFISDIKEST